MITYIIKSGLCIALILLVYKVLLERERMYKFNRYYLLFGLCFALVVPFITMEVTTEIPVVENTNVINFEDENFAEAIPLANETNQNTSSFSIWIVLLVSLYVIGYLVFFLRFMNNIYQIFYKITRNVKALYKKASLVLLKEDTLPHTFLHYIFIEKEAYETKNIAEELYTHELAHVTQKHTLDIIFIELIQIVFWFNPLLIYYKKAIQLNHEFLADDAVIKSNIQIPHYQQLLLDNASWNHNLYLASNLNFSVTKKRLQMMTKHTSRIRTWLFATLTIPIFIGALFLFSTKIIAQETATTAAVIIEIPTQEAQIIIQEDSKAAYYKNATFIFEDENGNKTSKKYAELTQEEKARLLPVPKTPLANRPTSTLLNNWKNKKEFAVWVDGKVIENATVSNYNLVHYIESFVHKNARSKRFPQAHQINLYTANGFESFKKKIASFLPEGAVLHFKKGKHSKKVGTTTPKALNAKGELAETKEEKGIQNKKDIVIHINKNGKFLVNYEHMGDQKQLNGFIKTELAKIQHKKARTGLIIYDGYNKKSLTSAIAEAKKALRKFKILNIDLMSSADVPPPPPPAPKKPIVIEVTEVNTPKPKKPVVIEVTEVNAPKPKKPVVIEVTEAAMPNVTEKKAKDIGKMHQNIRGEELKTMSINGKKHYYIIKNGVKYIYNEDSQLVDEKGNVIPPPPPRKKDGKASLKQVNSASKKTTKWKDVAYFSEQEQGKETGYVTINGETYYYTTKNGQRLVYNRYGQPVDKNGKVIPPPPPKKKVGANKKRKKGERTPLVGVKHVPDENATVTTFPTVNAGNIVAHVKVMNRHNAVFYYNEKRITYREALRMVRKNKHMHVYSQYETEKTSAFVKLTDS
ncbi:M56 family metallopeptidase [uncultured Kordia sp.]|uniref:M56 family metallopeptidase n=1 Tax=uncultured Kordia sp. TaxID=507699 RepID=UPI0026326190|nr:M56 family metallopeptidase [uncultured Kordia sp.]